MQRAGTSIGLLCLPLSLIVPPPAPITAIGMSRLGLLAFAAIWWTTTAVPLPMTTLAALGIGVLMGALTVGEAFAAPTHWIIWFVIGAFGMSAALERTGFTRRVALTFLHTRVARGRPHAFLAMFLLSAAAVSTVLSTTVVAVVWLSFARSIFNALRLRKGDPFAEIMAIGVIWAANIGGIGTPVGTASNPIAIAMVAGGTGHTLTFLTWTVVGLATSFSLMVVVILVVRYLVRPDASHLSASDTGAYTETELRALGAMTIAEKWAVGWGGFAILLWLVPDLANFTMPSGAARLVRERMDLVVPAVLVPVAMCLLPVGADRRPVLTWDTWSRSVEWGMVVFIGGVLVIGTAIAAPDTGIPDALGRALTPLLGPLPEYGVVLLLTTAAVLVTGAISNLVTMTIFVPLGLAVSAATGRGEPAALGTILGMAISLDYLLPSGTTSNAIVAGSGWLRVGTMLRYGLVMAIATGMVLTFVSYPIAKLLLR
jgi:sodium-dependent dicarboxylate transporter 2/3/5